MNFSVQIYFTKYAATNSFIINRLLCTVIFYKVSCLKQRFERLYNRLVSHLLLNEHTNGSKHSETAVLEFLRCHIPESFVGLWFQPDWIKANITWIVAVNETGTQCAIQIFRYSCKRLDFKGGM